MDFLKSQLDRIQQQLAGLNASQKMLAACLVIIIVMTVAWWGRQAGTSETASLFQEALDPADAARVTQLLVSHGIEAELGPDNRVRVPVAQHTRALSDLAISEAMPRGPSIDFDAFMKGLSPFTSQSLSEAHMVNFKSTKLADIIRRGFPDVAEAHVIIDAQQKWGLGGTSVEPTATVHITTRHGKPLPQNLVDGAASLVQGAQAGMNWNKIKVMVNGVPRRISDPETRGVEPTDLFALQEKQQKVCEDRIVTALRIPGASAIVSFGLLPESVRSSTDGYRKADTFTVDIETQEKTRESSGGGAAVPAGEPGAVPNVSMAIGSTGAGGGGDHTFTESDTRTKSQAFPSHVKEERVKAAGLSPPTGAAVLIPRSHVINVLKVNQKSGPDPDEQQIQGWLKKELPMLSKTVQTAANLDSVEKVSIGLYEDQVRLAADVVPAQVSAISTASLADAAGSHSREILLGGLAVVSLFMVSMMVRRGAPAAVAVAAGAMATVPMPLLDATEGLAGEVGEGKSMLDAMELDDDAVRAQQMVDQVAAMVEDNPDAAASLVKRWMSRT